MKILVVVHRFLPRHHAGAELYSLRLAKRLARQHEVVILTADDDLKRKNYSRRLTRHEGLQVIEITNHRRHDDFASTYADEAMEAQFEQILGQLRPDIVHFQHLLHHSFNYPAIASAMGMPTVLTLHEYWLLCARNGQLFDADQELCLGPGLEKCARCMSRFMWGRKSLDLFMLRGLAGVKRFFGIDLKAKARRIRLKGLAEDREIDPGKVEEMRKDLLLREASVRDLFEHVDCFIAPSTFLRDRFVDFGLDPDRIVHSDYGTELRDFRDITRVPFASGPLRIGFLGSMQPVKGVHVLLDALGRLEVGTFEAELYGDVDAKPEYVAAMGGRLHDDIRLRGQIPPDEVPRVLATFDVLVVPSIWWENSPLVIHEAFAAGIPVVCSDIGGMAELVDDGIDGLHFRVGDPADLAEKLARLAADRGLLDRLKARIREPRNMKSDAVFHEQLFEAVLDHYEQALDDHRSEVFEDMGHIEDTDGLEDFEAFLETEDRDPKD